MYHVFTSISSSQLIVVFLVALPTFYLQMCTCFFEVRVFVRATNVQVFLFIRGRYLNRKYLGQACPTYDPKGQTCPAEAFYLARKDQNFIHSACLLEKTPFEWVQKYRILPLDMLPCALLHAFCLFWPTRVSTSTMHWNVVNACENWMWQLSL